MYIYMHMRQDLSYVNAYALMFSADACQERVDGREGAAAPQEQYGVARHRARPRMYCQALPNCTLSASS